MANTVKDKTIEILGYDPETLEYKETNIGRTDPTDSKAISTLDEGRETVAFQSGTDPNKKPLTIKDIITLIIIGFVGLFVIDLID